MTMASTRSGGGDVATDVVWGGDADDRVDRTGSLGEVLIVVDIDGDSRNTLLFS